MGMGAIATPFLVCMGYDFSPSIYVLGCDSYQLNVASPAAVYDSVEPTPKRTFSCPL